MAMMGDKVAEVCGVDLILFGMLHMRDIYMALSYSCHVLEALRADSRGCKRVHAPRYQFGSKDASIDVD